MARKTTDRAHHLDEQHQARILRIEADVSQALRQYAVRLRPRLILVLRLSLSFVLDFVPPLEVFREPIHLFERKPERLADVAHSASRTIGNERRRERGAMA